MYYFCQKKVDWLDHRHRVNKLKWLGCSWRGLFGKLLLVSKKTSFTQLIRMVDWMNLIYHVLFFYWFVCFKIQDTQIACVNTNIHLAISLQPLLHQLSKDSKKKKLFCHTQFCDQFSTWICKSKMHIMSFFKNLAQTQKYFSLTLAHSNTDNQFVATICTRH